MPNHVVSTAIADLVENYADIEQSRIARRRVNGEPEAHTLDDEGIQQLYKLAGDIYAVGYSEGRNVTNMRHYRAVARHRARNIAEQES